MFNPFRVCVCVFFGRREVQNTVRVQLGLHLKYMGAGRCRMRRTFPPVVALGRKKLESSLLLDTGEKCLASQHGAEPVGGERLGGIVVIVEP